MIHVPVTAQSASRETIQTVGLGHGLLRIAKGSMHSAARCEALPFN
jgi:hypothetical protein